MMPVVYLIHWKIEEAEPRIRMLRDAGYAVRPGSKNGKTVFDECRADPPDVFVIDLSRLPSHGREIAIALRSAKATRDVPLVFAGGEPATVDTIRTLLPDAMFTSWKRMRTDLKHAMENRPSIPVVPSSVFAGYSGTPLPRKLGIRPGMTISLLRTPEHFLDLLGDGASDVKFLKRVTAKTDVTIWFVRSRAELERDAFAIAEAVGLCKLWIAWGKQSGPGKGDVTEKLVRETGAACGLVDFKVCSIDAEWSALLFVRRKS